MAQTLGLYLEGQLAKQWLQPPATKMNIVTMLISFSCYAAL